MDKLNKEIDIVIPLGEGSCWNNNELRFCLRSIEKNLANYRRIYIVGYKPDWIKNVVHIPCNDIYNSAINPDGNIIHKVLRACQVKGLSSDFLFMNDDYLVMKPAYATNIPAYHKGDMSKFPDKYFQKDSWRDRLKRTYKILEKKGLSTWHYDGHVPIIINKKKFPEILSIFDYDKGVGYCMKSLYANIAYKKGIHVDGIKKVIFRPYTLDMYDDNFSTCTFASVNDHGMTPYFKRWIYGKFPEASKFEKDPDNKVMQVLAWFNSKQDINEGIEVYSKYGKSGNVKKFFKQHRPSITFRKIEQHLHKII